MVLFNSPDSVKNRNKLNQYKYSKLTVIEKYVLSGGLFDGL